MIQILRKALNIKKDLSPEEEKSVEKLEDLLSRFLIWTIAGVAICLILTHLCPHLIGKAIIFFSVFLIYGLIKVSIDFDRENKKLKQKLENKKLLFSSTGEHKVENLFRVFLFLILFYISYQIISAHLNGTIEKTIGNIMVLWDYLSPDIKIDFFAVIIAFLLSIIIICTGILKASKLNCINILEEGIYIRDDFYLWEKIEKYEIKYILKRPVRLFLKTFNNTNKEIKLEPFNINSVKAKKIENLFQTHIKSQD